MKIRIGSRKSDLAQIQSRLVAAALKQLSPSLEFEFVFKDMGVDLNLNISLVEAEARGLFTKDLTLDLIEGKVDLLVHSWKDLPTAGTPETTIAATLEREDPRDVVFVKKSSLKKPELTFLSSSPRRAYNLNSFFSNYVFPTEKLNFIPVRGNLPTRMRKYLGGSEDALVMAFAAVKRLLEFGNDESRAILKDALTASQVVVVPVTENPPAPAQGALAIEVRRDRSDILALVEKINHVPSYRDVMAERDRLEDFGGGCHLALGIYQRQTKRGTLRVERGRTPAGDNLREIRWTPDRAPPAFAKDKFFDAGALNFFERREVKVEKPRDGFFLVSKAYALPSDWPIGESDVLWAAGLETWKKLRAKGLWVSGSQESLGENFFELPLGLWPDKRPYKLSHDDAPGSAKLSLLSTYELRNSDAELPDLSVYSAFYWSSASAYRAALAKFPTIHDAVHFCGIGNSFDELAKIVDPLQLFAVLSSKDCVKFTGQ